MFIFLSFLFSFPKPVTPIKFESQERNKTKVRRQIQVYGTFLGVWFCFSYVRSSVDQTWFSDFGKTKQELQEDNGNQASLSKRVWTSIALKLKAQVLSVAFLYSVASKFPQKFVFFSVSLIFTCVVILKQFFSSCQWILVNIYLDFVNIHIAFGE
jgi:hypothetical protein